MPDFSLELFDLQPEWFLILACVELISVLVVVIGYGILLSG